ncbi:twin-arginine translocation signal domain-containing protein [Candidatus Woesearchaeota archaeon]|nr:twin-arginine translocation signal domain-containing protein [Candidatus Woesearchaeota archaeon]
MQPSRRDFLKAGAAVSGLAAGGCSPGIVSTLENIAHKVLDPSPAITAERIGPYIVNVGPTGSNADLQKAHIRWLGGSIDDFFSGQEDTRSSVKIHGTALNEAVMYGLEGGRRYKYCIAGRPYWFSTSGYPSDSKPSKIAFIGDTQHRSSINRRLAKLMRMYGAELIVHLGDAAQNGADFSLCKRFINNISEASSNAAMLIAMGNHAFDAENMHTLFYFPGRAFSCTWGPIRFHVIDSSYFHENREKISFRLDRGIINILLSHYPPLCSRGVTSIEGILDYSGFDAVYSGHQHAYERFGENSCVQVISGGGGGQLWGVGKDERLVAGKSAFHFVMADAYRDRLECRVISHKNEIIDEFSIYSRG